MPDCPTEIVGQISHWTTFYYDKNVIHKYESKNYSSISSSQESFLYSLFPHKPKIVYHNVQEQNNNVDCGPFAIAFAISICHDIDPCTEQYDLSQLRSHLIDIYDNGELLRFPTIQNESLNPNAFHISQTYTPNKPNVTNEHTNHNSYDETSDSDYVLSEFEFQDNSEDDQEYEDDLYACSI